MAENNYILNESEFKRPESVLVLVYTELGHVLLLQRNQPEGFWQSVTGSLKWDESADHAAVRELFEETGLKDRPLINANMENSFPILPEWQHRYHPEVKENREYVYSLKLSAPCKIQLNPNEHNKYEWLDYKVAIQQCSSWTNCQAIEQIVKPG